MRKFSFLFMLLAVCFFVSAAHAVTVTVTAPDGGEEYAADELIAITWNANAAPENIQTTDIEYSTNNGASYTHLTTLNGDVFAYNWNNPNQNSDECLIRITVNDDNGGSADDVSNGTFTIAQAPVVAVTYPNGGQELYNGVQETFEWTVQSLVNYQSTIHVTTDHGNTWTNIGSVNTGDFDFDYTFNNTYSAGCRVRVTVQNVLGKSANDPSDNAFTVSSDPLVTVTSPDGNDHWIEGQFNEIEWTVNAGQNIDDNVIEFSTDNGANWTQIAVTNGNDFDYDWYVPDEFSEDCLIRVTTTGEFGYDGSDNSEVFTVSPVPDLTVVDPNGGEGYVTGDVVDVTWTVGAGPDIVESRVWYSLDNGANWINVGTTQNNDYDIDWNVINDYSEQCKIRVRVEDEYGIPAMDVSDAVFRISNVPAVEVNYPDGGEEFVEGEDLEISWDVTTAGQDIVSSDVEYSVDNGANWIAIGSTANNDFDIDWEIPAQIESAQCLIRVTSEDEFGTTHSNVSDGTFQISPQVRVTVTEPNGGEVFISGEMETIEWHAWHGGGPEPDFDSHIVHYSTDNGAHWTLIGQTAALDFDIDWQIPVLYSTNCLIRVQSTNEYGTVATDISNAVFTISPVPVVEVNTPNGGGIYIEDDVLTIEWDVTTGGQDVDESVIALSTDNGNTYNEIGTTNGNDFTFDYQIPEIYSTTARIRVTVTDEYGTEAADESDAVFTVAPIPNVEVVDPNGGEHLIEGNDFTINWSVTGGPSIDECVVEFTSDNGNIWNVLETTVNNDFDYVWTVPDVFSTSCLIRVTATDEYGSSATDVCDAHFTITPIPDVDIIEANGGEHYIEGDNIEFEWNVTGGPDTDESVISISYDNGANWTVLGTNQDDDYTFDWVAPDTYELDCLIKVVVTDEHGTVGEGQSDAVFGLSPIPDVTVITPNGGQHWIEEDVEVVEWNVTGGPAIDNNVIWYSNDNGANWIRVDTTQGSDFDYDWTIPFDYSFQCLTKIVTTDEYGAVGEDVSNAVYTITPIPDVTIIAPNGGEDFDSYDTTEVSWDVTTQPDIIQSDIEYSTDGGATWKAIGVNQDEDFDIDWVLPYLFDLYTVVRVTCTDEYGVQGYDISDNWFSIAFTHVTANIYRGWTILGFPLHPDNGSLEDLIGRHMVNHNPWDFFGFTMATSFYRPNVVDCEPGYLLTMFQDSITVDYDGYANRDLVTYDVDRGWNLFGNPFPVDIPVSDLNVRYDGNVYSINVAGDLDLIVPAFYEYENEGYVIADPIQDWRGYWYAALTEGVELLVIPAPPGPIPTAADEDYGTPDNWILNIQASKDGASDRLLTLGARYDASNGFDASYDFPDPPSNMVGSGINTYFLEPNWAPIVGNNFNRNIRHALGEGVEEWRFHLVTAEAGQVTLTWDDIFRTTPGGYEFEIVDGLNGRVINPKAQESYTFRNEGQRMFFVRVHAALDAPEEQETMPTVFNLSSVYPNPFNPTATVRYDVPHTADVNISLYDVNGNLVDVLANGNRAAGRYEVSISGNDLAGGIYFVKMTSTEYSAIKKAILVK